LFAAAIILRGAFNSANGQVYFHHAHVCRARPFGFTPNGARRWQTEFVSLNRLLRKENDFKFSIEREQFQIFVLPSRGGERLR
jgi:hypothetical protein